MDVEVWKTIPGHPKYEASSLGRIRSPRTVLATSTTNAGYLRTNLGSKAQGLVHRFVASAFLGPCPRGYCVAHKNGVKTDNRIENLKYATRSENALHCRFEGTDPCPLLKVVGGKPVYMMDPANRRFSARGERHGMATASESMVLLVHQLAASGLLTSEIAKQLQRKYKWVSNILAGRRWRHLHPDASKANLPNA